MSKNQTPAEQAADLESQGVCLICRKIKAETYKRGLCVADYEKYRRAKKKVTEELRDAWEQLLVDTGKIMPDARTSADPFLDALHQVMESASHYGASSNEITQDDDVDSDDERIDKEADLAYRRDAIKRKMDAKTKAKTSEKPAPAKRKRG